MDYLTTWIICGFLVWFAGTALMHKVGDGSGVLGFIIALVFSSVTLPNTELEHRIFTTEQEFVSAKTNIGTQGSISGSISGSFLMFSGTMGNVVQYKLRLILGGNRYQDVLIDNAIIAEDGKLKDTGVYIEHRKCNITATYSYLWMENKVIHPSTGEESKCIVESRLIRTPVGTVIKHIEI